MTNRKRQTLKENRKSIAQYNLRNRQKNQHKLVVKTENINIDEAILFFEDINNRKCNVSNIRVIVIG